MKKKRGDENTPGKYCVPMGNPRLVKTIGNASVKKWRIGKNSLVLTILGGCPYKNQSVKQVNSCRPGIKGG